MRAKAVSRPSTLSALGAETKIRHGGFRRNDGRRRSNESHGAWRKEDCGSLERAFASKELQQLCSFYIAVVLLVASATENGDDDAALPVLAQPGTSYVQRPTSAYNASR